MPSVRVASDTEIAYETKGTGRPLLMVHGFGLSGKIWELIEPELTTHHEVIRVDLRGHGLSSTPETGYDFETMANDLRTFIDVLHLKNVSVMGWSMGVSVLLELLKNPPAAIRSAVFVSGTPKFITSYDFHHGVPPAEHRKLTMEIKSNYMKGMQNFYGLLFRGEEVPRETFTRVTRFVTNEMDRPAQHVSLQCLESLAQSDFRSTVRAIEIPVLIAHGGADTICKVAASQWMHQQIKNSQLEVFDGVAHAPFLTQTKPFMEKVSAFLDR